MVNIMDLIIILACVFIPYAIYGIFIFAGLLVVYFIIKGTRLLVTKERCSKNYEQDL